MKKQRIGSAGGKATAIISRKKALDKYYANPNYCKHCNSVIEVKEGKKVPDTRKKVFCNHQCSANFYKKKYPGGSRQKDLCGCGKFKRKFAKICVNCYKNKLTHNTDISVVGTRDKRRSSISSNARRVFIRSEKEKKCCKCGYDKHIEVCHVKAVCTFSNDAEVSEINDIDNLVALCSNCHWEFDNGLLIL